MKEFFKRILKLSLTDYEQEVLDALNKSSVTSRKVVGRGMLTVDVKDITSSEKFKAYSEKATAIVLSQR